MNTGFARQRERMIAEQLIGRGIHDPRVLEAMRRVPRELFVPASYRSAAYTDQPLPIGDEQTISQPYVVARMAELAELDSGDVVLDVGCGSGYQTAVLAHLAERVYGVEIRAELAEGARRALDALGIANAEVVCGDGGHGLPQSAPFDAILVAAAAEEPPAPLLAQLADGGRLVMPLGPRSWQLLTRLVRRGDRFERDEHDPVRFVAFIGDFGDSFGEDSGP